MATNPVVQVSVTITLENGKMHYDYIDYENDSIIDNQLCVNKKYIRIKNQMSPLSLEYINKNLQTV